jgi:hypothetical protein
MMTLSARRFSRSVVVVVVAAAVVVGCLYEMARGQSLA